MNLPILSQRTYIFLYSLLGLVYIAGLFVPLMDNDSGHHANIGLRMYLTGDYVNMIDHRGDYIDKPHFLFWVSAFSYHVFGVTSFAYKFPSLLFTILGTYSIFRLGKELYNHETGKLAALIAASSFCYILANNDVRMDAILTACIAFASWHLVVFVKNKKIASLVWASLGLAIGFATKGHVGLVTPVIGILFYIFYRKDWMLLYDPRWLLVVLLFFVFIFPVLYCYYLQYDLHPEKVSQGMKGVSGLRYILWDHSFDRISGHERFGAPIGKEDRFFFLHTFLWTFAPWSIVAFIAFFLRLKNFFKRNNVGAGKDEEEWLSTGMFFILGLLINFSNFKLPHYLPIVVPAAALITAHFFARHWLNKKWTKAIIIIQYSVCVLLLLLAAIVNMWVFPLKNILLISFSILLLSFVFYFVLTKYQNTIQKAISVSVATMALFFFLLNTNFYPKLLNYQGGKPLADLTRQKADPKKVYFWNNTFSSSYNFYTASLRQVYNDTLLKSGQKFWLIFDKSQQAAIDSSGLLLGQQFSVADYEVTRLKKKFLDPATRKETLTEMRMAEVVGRK